MLDECVCEWVAEMSATLKDRIVAHRTAPDVYDPPTFDAMADRIEELEAKLAKAVEALSYYANHEILIQYYDDASTAQDTLAELKGQDDE